MALEDKPGIDRRTFLKEVGAVTLAGTSNFSPHSAPASPAEIAPPLPLQNRPGRRIFRGEHLRAVAMPLGGIGTGSIALAGDGGLRQWQVTHSVNHQAHVPHSFFAFWAKPENGPSVARVLQSSALYDQSSFKPPVTTNDHVVPEESKKLLHALPGVKELEFAGEYPIAEIRYLDRELPADVSLTAYSPFVPLDDKTSGLPLIVFEFQIKNTTSGPLRASVMSTLQNFVGWDGHSPIEGVQFFAYGANRNAVAHLPGLTLLQMTNSRLPDDFPFQGTLALATPSEGASFLAHWDNLDRLWKDFSDDGKLEDREGAEPSGEGRTWNGALAVPLELKAGEEARAVFFLTWHFPNRYVNWGQPALTIPDQKTKFYIGTMYGNWFKNATEVAVYARDHHDDFSRTTRLFRDTFYDSFLPYALLDCVSSQASIMRTPTCIRIADGHLHGFEGCCGASTDFCGNAGCCPLNCTHVWNYEQALARLFPELERGMRYTDLEIQQAPEGYIPHRTILPFYLPRNWGKKIGGPENPALDGMLGTILKTYREYRLGAGDDWLKNLWPRVKKLMTYIITTLDDDQDGVIFGEQPNTYDTSMYGPNSFMGGLYLAALRAAEEMAKIALDQEAAAHYRKIFKNGNKNLPELLWDGEYYIQKVDLEKYTADQYGTGCHSDQLLGQWWATQLDLGYILPKDQIHATLQSIMKNNWRKSFVGFKQAPRVFVSDQDKGLLVCTWPKGGRPKSPTPYSDEVWTGIEYEVAGLLLQEGMVDDALEILHGLRERYDGRERSPWNDIECGDHYARAMSSWTLLEAAAGQHTNTTQGFLGFAPRIGPQQFRSFFITADGWGSFDQRFSGAAQTNALTAAYGSIKLKILDFNYIGKGIPKKVKALLPAQVAQPRVTIVERTVRLEWPAAVELKAGDRWQVEIT